MDHGRIGGLEGLWYSALGWFAIFVGWAYVVGCVFHAIGVLLACSAWNWKGKFRRWWHGA